MPPLTGYSRLSPDRLSRPRLPLADAASCASVSAKVPYDRARDLPRLLPLWPSEVADRSPEAHHRLLQRLRQALREERRRGLAGDWTYDLVRHAGLYRAWKAEMAAAPLPLTTWAAAPFRHR